MFKSKARITAIGSYVPEKRLTNKDLEKMVETNDEWIVKRTGIKERRIAHEEEFTSDIGYKAVKDLMERYDKSVEDVDMIIVCTFTPDFNTPSVASLVQAKLGIKNTGAIDLNAACAGFTYGLHVANGLVTSGLNKKILVIGADTLSKLMDYEDRATCILFGDGGGAVLVEYDEKQPSFLSSHLYSEGEGGKHLYSTNLSTRINGEDLNDSGNLVQNGREVYKWAVTTVPKGMQTVMKNAEYQLNDVDWFVPHSANLRMIESICERSGFPIERTLYSLVEYGNTSSATIPLSLEIGIKEGKLRGGEKVLLYGFGGGLAQAGLLIDWTL
ncbi:MULTISPECIES: ketoacyl-ACP synthase III [Peribacillus]|jgi:3-oxoacyl-[acyl-carrier-protein] synthase-3|uniref:Beta-ketoacyl-[acyl-carrier-protein] synthase III n=1 Tax=Peribacillus frigoritolerans TaxID=450367 RepID=A0AAJ1V9R8_9BACI|nr:ketoacyl-ACP synthase III [Peribacillus frigoritolerans]MCD1162591.1 ketoacyl-ACP synthase III [Peribacillus castrilensis]PHD73753.1 ketoacyl-ACP synthase III [Bacillus sp. AFS043905]QYF82660.1 ketoacyl-ACP synthase III [Brevibacterium sp. PAMC21349]MCM3168967.1 ketoacyl-ACP synthase III [Peribacillus frigoritolerans]MDM5282434.1 ketoacyl-ACP synthase III [Peribacillus frigoritolerans]